jgi:hypothetical protein
MMAARKTLIVDVVDCQERVAVSRIAGTRPVVLEFHRLKREPGVAFIELTREQAADVRDALSEILNDCKEQD